MDFFVLAALAVVICLLAIAAAVLIPRRVHAGLLRKQLQQVGGHIFTPDSKTWQGYLARTASLGPLLSLLLYAGLQVILLVAEAGPGAIAIGVAAGIYLVLRQLLQTLPPTYGVTGKGITVISWLPNFPLGPFGSGSTFIPWQAVEVCAIDELYLTVLTPKKVARVVYPPEIEEKVCGFIDSLLRHRGYITNTAK